MSLAREAAEGLRWTTAAKTFAQLVGVVVTLALARILTPADFGLIAMVAVITGFLSVFGDMGFAEALVQRQEIEERHRSSVFWLNVAAGLSFAAVLASSAPWIARFYGDARLTWIVRLLAIDFALAPLQMVQHATLLREMRFRALALAEAVSVLLSSLIGLGLALFGFGVGALVAKSIAGTLGGVVTLWAISGWRPRALLDRRALAELWGFSSHLLGFSTLSYWARQVDDLLIGRVLGPVKLGLYGRAFSTMMMPVNEVGSVLTRVMFPTFSKLQQEPSETKRIYLRIVSVLGFITFPVMFGLSVLSEPFIRVLYGEQWVAASRVLSIYCFVGCSVAIASTTTWIFKARGRTDLMFRWGVAAASLTIGSMVVGILLGSIESVAICYALMHIVVLSYPRYSIPGRLIDMRPSEVWMATRGALGASIVMAAAVWALGLVTTPRLAPALDLSVRTGVGVFAYGLCAKLFGVRGMDEMLQVVRGKLLEDSSED